MTFSSAVLESLLPKGDTTQRLWVALSGGLDSVVLLHALASLNLATPLRALHVNHQISPHANRWQQHCESLCAELQVPFHAEVVQVERAGHGLEDAARVARYAVFERHLQAGDFLLTAHHADDQVETFFLRLLRGAGPRGLAAMAQQRPLGVGYLYRPLLTFSRAELQTYADIHQLTWVEDESNLDTHYDRNYLRQRVIPLLQERWPQLQRRIQQSADLWADSEALLMELAEQDSHQCKPRPERLGQSLCLLALAQLTIARRHNVLRYWLRNLGFDMPEQLHLQQFEQQLMAARQDAEVALGWGNLVLHRYRGRLYVLPRPSPQTSAQVQQIQAFALNAQTAQVPLPNGGDLTFEYCEEVSGLNCLSAHLRDLSLRWRQGGERCRPAGRAHSQTLKRLLQEYALEPWWRDALPLVFSSDELVAVGDLWVCHGFVATVGQPGYRLVWRPSGESDHAVKS
jgi:tRNA(Ile)-lysidine synthase